MPFVQTFIIEAVDHSTRFEGGFADGSPIVTEGYGGWQVTNRPREIGITEWSGRNPMAIEIPFRIEHWMDDDEDAPGVACEREVRNLEALCGLGGHAQPPICKVDGHGIIPHDDSVAPGSHQWVIENVTWDRDIELRSGTSGRRVRCGGTIVIRQYIYPSDVFRRITSRSRAQKPKVYIVKRGDTLSKIAKQMYGDPNKWKRIADANKIRDRRNLKIGQHLKIP